MARSNPTRKRPPQLPQISTILLHEKTHLLHGSRTGPSILTGTIFNQMKWYVDHGLVRKLHFSATTPHTTTLFAAYEDLLHELHPGATAADMRWDYLKLEVPQKRAVERVLDDGSWTPGEILNDLPKRSMHLYLRCRYVPADQPSPSDTDDTDDADADTDTDSESVSALQTPAPKSRARSTFAFLVSPETPLSEDELSVSVNTRYVSPLWFRAGTNS